MEEADRLRAAIHAAIAALENAPTKADGAYRAWKILKTVIDEEPHDR